MATTECDWITRALRRRPAADSVLWRFWEGQGSLSGSKTAGGAGGARTHDRRIMRTAARRSGRSTCTDTTAPCHRWPSLHCMHGWLGPRTGPRPPQRAPDVNYGASPHTARDPPLCTATRLSAVLRRDAQIGLICACKLAEALT
jgi:hypothetical protein